MLGGRLPLQDVAAARECVEIIQRAAQARPIKGANFVEVHPHLAAPFLAQRFGLGIGEAGKEVQPLHGHRRQEHLGGHRREGLAIGDLGIGADGGGAQPQIVLIGARDGVGGDETRQHRPAKAIGGARRGNAGIAHLLKDRIDPIGGGVEILLGHDLAGIGTACAKWCRASAQRQSTEPCGSSQKIPPIHVQFCPHPSFHVDTRVSLKYIYRVYGPVRAEITLDRPIVRKTSCLPSA